MSSALAKWADSTIPALGGKTPRQAVRSAKGRDDVAVMLLEQERLMRRTPFGGSIDYAAVWTDLGLQHPDQAR